MEIVGYNISVYWPKGEKRFGPGTIQTWFAVQYDRGVDEAREKAMEHLEFLKEHAPEEQPQLVVLYAENGGW